DLPTSFFDSLFHRLHSAFLDCLPSSPNTLDTLQPVDQLQHSFIIGGILYDQLRFAVYSQEQRTTCFLDFSDHLRCVTLKLFKRVNLLCFVRHCFISLLKSLKPPPPGRTPSPLHNSACRGFFVWRRRL